MCVRTSLPDDDGKSPKGDDDYLFGSIWVNASYTEVTTKKYYTDWTRVSPVEGVEAKIGVDTGSSPHPPHPHVVGEMRIPLSIVGTATFGFFMRFVDASEALTRWFYWPGPTLADQGTDPSSWGNVSISLDTIPEFSNTLLVVALAVLSALAVSRFRNRRGGPIREQDD
jgi:hypothetical protein